MANNSAVPTVEQLDRRDVTESYPGHPLRLGLRVVDGACTPVAGAQVEIRHTDASVILVFMAQRLVS